MNKTVLIVEDIEKMRGLLNAFLTNAGYKTIIAKNSIEAINILKSNSIQLVICDLDLPEINGLELVKAIKGDPLIRHIHIFMLSKDSEQEFVKQGKEFGVTAWIVKPFVPDKLLLAVKKVLKN